MNKDRCATCRHWRVFPENNLAGRCPLLGVILWPKAEFEELLLPATDVQDMRLQAELSLTHRAGFGTTFINEALAVRTQHDFGCINHEPRS